MALALAHAHVERPDVSPRLEELRDSLRGDARAEDTEDLATAFALLDEALGPVDRAKKTITEARARLDRAAVEAKAAAATLDAERARAWNELEAVAPDVVARELEEGWQAYKAARNAKARARTAKRRKKSTTRAR